MNSEDRRKRSGPIWLFKRLLVQKARLSGRVEKEGVAVAFSRFKVSVTATVESTEGMAGAT
jgi:hypothetical protein